MFSDPTTPITYLAFFIALIAGGGLTLQRTKVRELRQDVDDERGRTASGRAELADLKIKFADSEARHQKIEAEQKAEIEQLRIELRHTDELAKGQDHWDELKEELTQTTATLTLHDERALREIANIENRMVDVLDKVSAALDRIADVDQSTENLAEQFHRLASRWDDK